MESTASFDLNRALRHWLQQLGQSPQFETENLVELEAHIRDSVVQLETKGLSAEESFLIATRRVGDRTQLEPEFAKINRSWWPAIIHGLILGFFSLACWFLWAVTKISTMMAAASVRVGRPLPAFSQFVIDCGPWLAVPPLVALAYCLLVWTKTSPGRSSWMGFFAVVMAVLFLLAIPILIAAFLPLIDTFNGLLAKPV